LTTKTIESPSLPLQGVDDVHGGDGLPTGVLGVGDCVADHVLEEDLEDAAGLLVDKPADALHAAPPRQAPDRRLGDALDVVAEHLAVALRPALAQTLAALPSSRHRLRTEQNLQASASIGNAIRSNHKDHGRNLGNQPSTG
ncbi:hypothetical protein MUK42_04191, partial [Musa troglodytarum]